MMYARSKKRIKIKKLVLFFVITLSILILCMGLYAAYAWQKDADTVQNNLKTGTLSVLISEDSFTAGAGMTAGESYGDASNKKRIDITSGGSLPGVVRVMVLPIIKEAAGGEDLLLDTAQLTFVNRNTDWIDGGDGYYYYKEILLPGNTVNFCENVQLGSVDAEYDGFTLDIEVVSEAKYITRGAYEYEQAWWNATPNTTGNINTILRAAIDIYAAAYWD